MVKSIKLPVVIAHRGASGEAPENTLAAFGLAQAQGAEWIETDVRLSPDGELYLFHDDELNRTSNGSGNVYQTPFTSLMHLDAGAWFSPEFSGQKIPTLREALAYCRDLNLGMNLEIKPGEGQESALLKALLLALEDYPDCPILLSSFSLPFLINAREMHCPYPLAWNLEKWRPDVLETAKNLDLYSVHFSEENASRERIQSLKQAGKRVYVFTVNTLPEAQSLIERGVDGVFSDYPKRLIAGLCHS